MNARLFVVGLVAGPLLLGGCTGEPTTAEPTAARTTDGGRIVISPPDESRPHTHTTQVGDGTTADAGGYSLTDLRFPTETRTPSDLSFRILDSRGEPVVDYLEEQTKLLHLYVVSDDYGQFRHLHPALADDGTWTARVDLAAAGRYRVVAEFVPASQPDGSHVVLAARALVEGPTPEPPETPAAPGATGTDGLVTIAAPESVGSGRDIEFTLTVSDGDRGVLNLGTYLGAYAHLTGFDEATGAFVHAHPLGPPEITDDGSELTFHTTITVPGSYRLFVQVRVDGFVHTVPLTLTVT